MSRQIEELKALKDRRSRNREVRDFEERILLDNLEETERMLNGTPVNTHRKKFPLSKHDDIRQLQVQYERMREEEKRLHQESGPRRPSYRSDESRSIHLMPHVHRSKYDPNKDPKLQSLAANHGKQMEFLSKRNQDLERQRDEIRRRLGELGKKPADTDNTSALLAELRDQEARNQRLLDELKKQLLAARQPVAIIGEQQTHPAQQKKTYTYPVYYGNSLVAEISAIRQAYIQSGGNDPEILAQLAQMLAEAQAIEEAMRNRKQPEVVKKKEKRTEVTSHVMTLDLENERLNRELMLLQEQNLMARNRRKDDREGRLPTLGLGLGGKLGSSLKLSGTHLGTSSLGMSGTGLGLTGTGLGLSGTGLGFTGTGLGLSGTGLGLSSKRGTGLVTLGSGLRTGLGLSGTLGHSSRLGLGGTGYSSFNKSTYANPLSTLNTNSLYKSILEQSDTDDTNLALLNSITGRASVRGRPGTGLGYRSYRPGFSYRNSFLGEGGLTSVSKYGLNPSIRDSLELRNNDLVDIGTSPIPSSRLARPITSLGLRSPVIGPVEPHKRQPYPLDSVQQPNWDDVPYYRPYTSAQPLKSTLEIELRDSYTNPEEPYEYKETHPTVPKLKLYTDPPPDEDENPEKEESKKTPTQPVDQKKKVESKKSPETRQSDGSRSVVIEPAKPLKSALKNSKTLEPSSPSDLNNHPSNLKRFAEPDEYEVYDSDVIYDPVPDTVQNPPPKKPSYSPKVYEQLNSQKIIPIHTARSIPSTNQFIPIYSSQPYITPSPLPVVTPVLSTVPPVYVQTIPPYIPPADPQIYQAPTQSEIGKTPTATATALTSQSTQPPPITYLPMSHPDMYHTPPNTAASDSDSTPGSSHRKSRPRPARQKPGVSPIPEESLSDRPSPVGDSSPSPYDRSLLTTQDSSRVLHSYPKPPTDPNDPYNYYAKTGWPPVKQEKLHKDHKNYHPLNPSHDDSQTSRPTTTGKDSPSVSEKSDPKEDPKKQGKLEAEQQKKDEAEKKQQAKAREEARKKAEEARKKEEAEAKKKAIAEEKAKKKAEEEAKKKAKILADARKKAEAQAKKEAANARKKADAEAKKNKPQNVNQNKNSEEIPNQSSTENNYRFKDNFVGRKKQAENKKAVSFTE